MGKAIRLLRADEIEVRVNTIDKSSSSPKWASLLLYKDARADYNLLDETFGAMNWQCEYTETKGGLFCTIKIWNDGIGEWICKTNVGTPNPQEPAKSEASDALKRAAVVVGIGRELYSAPDIFINLTADDCRNGRLNQSFYVSDIGYDKNKRINKLVIKDKRHAVRYSLGASTPNPTAANTGDDFLEKQLNEAVKQIESASTIEELTTIYNGWSNLQTDGRFLSALTAKKAALKAI